MTKIKALVITSLVSLSAAAQEPCKTYLGIEGGYDFGYDAKSSYLDLGTNAKTPSLSFTKQQRGLLAGMNLGYTLTDSLSAEMGLEWAPKLKSSIGALDLETRKLGAKAGLNYQWNTSSTLSPFVFAGVGLMHLDHKLVAPASTVAGETYKVQLLDDTGAVKGDLLTETKFENKTVARVHGGFGLAMASSDKVSMVIKYGLARNADYTIKKSLAVGAVDPNTQVLNGQEIKMKDIKITGQMDQSLTVGVKIML